MTFLSSLIGAVIPLVESESTISKYGKCSATKEGILETRASQQLPTDSTCVPSFWPPALTAEKHSLTIHFKRGWRLLNNFSFFQFGCWYPLCQVSLRLLENAFGGLLAAPV